MDGLLSYLSPDQQQMAMQNARTQGLLGLGAALLQGSTGAPGQGKPRLGQILGQALPVGMQAYQGGIDQTLQQILVGQKMQEMQRQREMQARQQQAQAQLAQMTQPVTPLTALSAPGRAGPTAERAETIGQVPQMTREQALRMAMNPDLPGPDREALFKYVEATKPAEPKLGPGVVGEFQAAQAAGLIPAGTTLQQFVELKKPLAPSATANVSVLKDFGGTINETLKTIKGQMLPASRALNTVQNMQGLLEDGVRTGFGQETVLKFSQAGQLFNPDYKAKSIAGQEAFIAASNELILPQVKQLGVNPTDADLNFIKQGSPTLAKSVAGNRLMLKGLQIKFERDKALANWATQWQINNARVISSDPITADARFSEAMNQFMETNPLFVTAAQQLRQEYNSIVGQSQSSNLPPNNPFVRQK
jgi:hypothetical protein